MELLFPLGTALLLGSLHAVEADHMAAVGAFALRRPHAGGAAVYGARWALGHGAVLVAAGALLLFLRLQIPPGAGEFLERLVGASLIALGVWTALGARALHVHAHLHADGTRHAHVHSHAVGGRADHRHAATAIGALHGLAGTAPILALVPLAAGASTAAGLSYLVAFAIGTACGMTLLALITGWLARRAVGRSLALARFAAIGAGAATVGIGVLWLLR